jgi:hypothetical protein
VEISGSQAIAIGGIAATLVVGLANLYIQFRNRAHHGLRVQATWETNEELGRWGQVVAEQDGLHVVVFNDGSFDEEVRGAYLLDQRGRRFHIPLEGDIDRHRHKSWWGWGETLREEASEFAPFRYAVVETGAGETLKGRIGDSRWWSVLRRRGGRRLRAKIDRWKYRNAPVLDFNPPQPKESSSEALPPAEAQE